MSKLQPIDKTAITVAVAPAIGSGQYITIMTRLLLSSAAVGVMVIPLLWHGWTNDK